MSFQYLDIPLTESFTSRKVLKFPTRKDPLPDVPFINVQLLDIDDAKVKESNYLLGNSYSFFVLPYFKKYSNEMFDNEKDKEHLGYQGKRMIHPYSLFRFCWIVTMCLLLTANLTILPIFTSFFSNNLTTKMIVLNCFFDAVFIVDIIITFCSGLVLNNYKTEIILSHKKVAWHYVRSWFIVDLLSSIPFDYMYFLFFNKNSYSFLHTGTVLRILRKFKILSLIRFLRIFRLVRYVLIFEEILGLVNKYMSMINMTLIILFLTHWCSCIQFFVSLILNFPESSWVTTKNLRDENWSTQYMWSLHKTLSNMFRLEYGKYPPISTIEAWVTLSIVIIGAILGILFVLHFILLLLPHLIKRTLTNDKLTQIERYITYKRILEPLKVKILDYYSYRYKDDTFDGAHFLEDLPEGLKKEVMTFSCQDLMKTSQLFQIENNYFLSDIAAVLKMEFFQPGETIVSEGTLGKKMYFVKSGRLSINSNDGQLQTTLTSKSSFGDLCLLSKCIRTANVTAESRVKLYSLEQDCFLLVLENYLSLQQKYQEIAKQILTQVFNNSCWQERLHSLENKGTPNDNIDAFPKYFSDGKGIRKLKLLFQKIIESAISASEKTL